MVLFPKYIQDAISIEALVVKKLVSIDEITIWQGGTSPQSLNEASKASGATPR